MRRRSKGSCKDVPAVAAATPLGIALLLVGTSAQGQEAGRKYFSPAVVPLEGRLDVAAAKSFERRLDRAIEAKTDLLVVEIDVASGTPEGARVACDALRRAGGAKKVAYIGRRALGPGLAGALCCDEIQVKPDAVVGNLGPLVDGSDRAEWASLLQSWGRDQRRPAEALARLIDDPGAVLTGRNAAAERLADGAAESSDEVLANAGAARTTVRFAETWVDDAVRVLNHPVTTTALVVTGLVFLYIEVAAAGIGLAALPAAFCFLLFFWSKFLGGTAGWLEVVLFLAGLSCLLLEIFVIPGFGVVGAAGIALVLLSLVMATQGFLLPRTPTDTRVFVQTLVQWSAGALLFVAAAAAITKRVGGLPVVKALVLAPLEEPVSAGVAGAVLPEVMTGVAATDLRPVGKARFGDRLVDVVTDGFYIPAGATIRVVEASPHRVQVTRVS